MTDKQDVSPATDRATAPPQQSPQNGTRERHVATATHALRPDADIFEDADGITVTLDVPGVASNALDIRVDKQSLNIEAEASIDVPAGTEPLHAEVRSTRYRRSFSLSRELEGDRIEANLKDGVLTLRIPKRAEVKPRRVEVRAQ